MPNKPQPSLHLSSLNSPIPPFISPLLSLFQHLEKNIQSPKENTEKSNLRQKNNTAAAIAMAERHSGQAAQRPSSRPSSAVLGSGGGGANTFLQKLQDRAPNSTQVVGFLTLVISGGILIFLTGLTITTTVLGLIFFTPLIVLSSPIWFPVGTVLFLSIAGFLSMCGFGIAVLAGGSWMYKYFKGRHPPGSDRVDYARSRIADTASHMKDYAREYSGYLQSKVKDAAPGA